MHPSLYKYPPPLTEEICVPSSILRLPKASLQKTNAGTCQSSCLGKLSVRQDIERLSSPFCDREDFLRMQKAEIRRKRWALVHRTQVWHIALRGACQIWDLYTHLWLFGIFLCCSSLDDLILIEKSTSIFFCVFGVINFADMSAATLRLFTSSHFASGCVCVCVSPWRFAAWQVEKQQAANGCQCAVFSDVNYYVSSFL